MNADFAAQRAHGSMHARKPEIWSHDQMPVVVRRSGSGRGSSLVRRLSLAVIGWSVRERQLGDGRLDSLLGGTQRTGAEHGGHHGDRDESEGLVTFHST